MQRALTLPLLCIHVVLATPEIDSISPSAVVTGQETVVSFEGDDIATGNTAKWVSGVNCDSDAADSATIDATASAKFTISSAGTYRLCWSTDGNTFEMSQSIMLTAAKGAIYEWQVEPDDPRVFADVEMNIQFNSVGAATQDKARWIVGWSCDVDSTTVDPNLAFSDLDPALPGLNSSFPFAFRAGIIYRLCYQWNLQDSWSFYPMITLSVTEVEVAAQGFGLVAHELSELLLGISYKVRYTSNGGLQAGDVIFWTASSDCLSSPSTQDVVTRIGNNTDQDGEWADTTIISWTPGTLKMCYQMYRQKVFMDRYLVQEEPTAINGSLPSPAPVATPTPTPTPATPTPTPASLQASPSALVSQVVEEDTREWAYKRRIEYLPQRPLLMGQDIQVLVPTVIRIEPTVAEQHVPTTISFFFNNKDAMGAGNQAKFVVTKRCDEGGAPGDSTAGVKRAAKNGNILGEGEFEFNADTQDTKPYMLCFYFGYLDKWMYVPGVTLEVKEANIKRTFAG